jgi:hypothetical protein
MSIKSNVANQQGIENENFRKKRETTKTLREDRFAERRR